MIKEGDFVRVKYEGFVDGKKFDENEVTIIVGAGHVIRGLEKALIKRRVGEEFEVDIEPKDGFGERSEKLVRIIPRGVFKREGVNPVPGMRVNVDNLVGKVVSVGGRVVVDFNHPLAGKKLHYKVKVLGVVKGKEKKLGELFKFHTGREGKVEGNQIFYEGEVPEVVKRRIFEDAKKWLGVKELLFTQVWK